MAMDGGEHERRTNQSSAIPHGILGMMIFVISECMFFAGMISGFIILKSSAMVWPPLDQPRLPIEATAFNTLVLLASGAMLYLAHRAFHRGDRAGMRKPMLAAMALATFFVLFQGVEWVRLLGQGLTISSSSLGSFFYLIVGVHAMHSVAAIILLGHATLQLQRGWLTANLFGAAEVFWFFVVGLWPILYAVVYL
jgi:cytochrome c oxidase subunit 3